MERPDRMPELCFRPPCFLRAWVLFFWLSLCLSGVHVFAQEFSEVSANETLTGQKVGAVHVGGAQTWTEQQILGRLKTREGQPYNSADVSTDLKELGRIMRTATVDTQTMADGN